MCVEVCLWVGGKNLPRNHALTFQSLTFFCLFPSNPSSRSENRPLNMAFLAFSFTGGQQNAMFQELMTVEEVAQMLRVPCSWVYARTSGESADSLPFLKIGRHLRFRRAEIEHWLESCHRNALKPSGSQPEGQSQHATIQ